METFRYQICLLWSSILIRALQGLTYYNLIDSCKTLTYEPRPHFRMPWCSEICFEVVSVLPYDSDQQLHLGNSRLTQIAGLQRLFPSSGSLKSTPVNHECIFGSTWPVLGLGGTQPPVDYIIKSGRCLKKPSSI